MKWNKIFKKSRPHIVAILLMYIITVIYFNPVFFDGKNLPQGDQISVIGMTKALVDYQKESGEYSSWSNSMFSGMPMETVYGQPAYNIYNTFLSLLRGGLPYLSAGIFFALMLGFYVFMLCIGAEWWLALIGALAYALASFNLISIDAGHITKVYAMACMAPAIGGVLLLYRGKYILGTIVSMIFIGVLISRGHIQISYYTAIIIGCVVLAYFVSFIVKSIRKTESFTSFIKATLLLLFAAFLGVIPSAGGLYPTYKYSKDTMRGGSELTIVPDSKKTDAEAKPNEGGLEIDYAYAWSYGKAETFTLLVPNAYGSGHAVLDKSDPVVRELRNAGYGSPYLPTYWGDQPFTAGPVYVGAIVCFLFILGLFVVKGPEKWWVIAVVIISFILAWGRHLMPVNEWLFHHLPMYNKFRTPSMALTIAGVAMPILGMLALKDIFSGNIDKKQAWKYTWISAAISAGLCLLVMLLGKTMFSFMGTGDANFQQQLASAGFDQGRIDNIMDILINYRKSMLMKDAFRSLVFIALAFGVLALYCKNIVKKGWIAGVSLIVLVLADMWPVAQRYLNDDHFVSKKKAETPIVATEADNAILQDPDINYRVLNLASNTFNESQTSYFHKSIGGYSPAKLRRYQDMIDFYIGDQMQNLYREIIRTQGNLQAASDSSFQVLNMLNTKYVIVPVGEGKTMPLQNPYRFGNAWFVNEAQIVANPDEEILALGKTDLKNVAVVDQRYKDYVSGKDFTRDTTATIVNILCKPNKLKYKTSASREQLAVFSEVFYDKGGWIAHIDGKEVPHFRSDYILRTMVIPAGEHEIEFNYVPHARILGCKISNISSVICILIILAGCGWGIYKRRKEPQVQA
jgi:hypothetical protein